MAPFISVIIPNHNGAKTIGLCLEAALKSTFSDFEVIVVDDCSSDNSTAIISKYPCRLIPLKEHGGASKTRNTGAENSNGEVLFFIDADCLLLPETLSLAAAAYQEKGPGVVVGGTYTRLPYDQGFFSTFQSVFINYSETKNPGNPDYIATHAMLISRELYLQSRGLNENFMPILEDVEFSHRLKKSGAKLLMDPKIQVQHIFNFTLAKSMRNGIRKSKYWSIYSIKNRDVLADSGTASQEFKLNVVSCFVNLLLLLLAIVLKSWPVALIVPVLFGCSLFMNRKLISAFHETKGPFFAIFALLYYSFIYPFAVGIGVFSGIFSQHFGLRP